MSDGFNPNSAAAVAAGQTEIAKPAVIQYHQNRNYSNSCGVPEMDPLQKDCLDQRKWWCFFLSR